MWENVIFQQENVLIKIYGGRMHIHHVILKDSCREVSINLISEIKLVLRATCRQPPDHMNSSRELVIRPHSSIHYHKGSVDKKKKWTADIWQSFHGQKQKGADNHIGWAQSTPDSRHQHLRVAPVCAPGTECLRVSVCGVQSDHTHPSQALSALNFSKKLLYYSIARWSRSYFISCFVWENLTQ